MHPRCVPMRMRKEQHSVLAEVAAKVIRSQDLKSQLVANTVNRSKILRS